MEICKTGCLFIIKCPIGIVNRGDAEGAQPAGCAFFMVRLCGLPRSGRRLGGAFSRTGIANADLQTAYPKLHIRGLRGRTAGKKGETLVSPFLSIIPFPSGRAARARVSSTLRLPPSCLDRVSRTDSTPGNGVIRKRGRTRFGSSPLVRSVAVQAANISPICRSGYPPAYCSSRINMIPNTARSGTQVISSARSPSVSVHTAPSAAPRMKNRIMQ